MTITITINPEHLGSLVHHLVREHYRARRIRKLTSSSVYLREVAGDIRTLVGCNRFMAEAMRDLLRVAFRSLRNPERLGGAR